MCYTYIYQYFIGRSREKINYGNDEVSDAL